MARTRPRKYIALNREDDAWVPGKLDGRKARQRLDYLSTNYTRQNRTTARRTYVATL